MALLSDDADFYFRAAATWLLTATIAVAIVRGWIRGHGFRANKFQLAVVLVYSVLLARHALRLRMIYWSIPKSRRLRCPGAAAVPVGTMMERADISDLVRVADGCFLMMLVLGMAVRDSIWGKRMPAALRPRVPATGSRSHGGVGSILVEIPLLVPCVWSCIHGLPVLVRDYYISMAAAANCGDAAMA